MEKRTHFLMDLSWREAFEELPPVDAKKLIVACMRYNAGLPVDKLPTSCSLLFKSWCNVFERNFQTRQQTSIQRLKAINKRWNRDTNGEELKLYDSIRSYTDVYGRIHPNTDMIGYDMIGSDVMGGDVTGNDVTLTNVSELNNKTGNKSSSIYSENFEKFWKEYPKKKGKQKAYEAYQNAVKKGVTEEVLIQKAKDFATECHLKHVEEQFIKRPQGWLNEGRYDDEFYTGKKDKKKIDLDDLY